MQQCPVAHSTGVCNDRPSVSQKYDGRGSVSGRLLCPHVRGVPGGPEDESHRSGPDERTESGEDGRCERLAPGQLKWCSRNMSVMSSQLVFEKHVSYVESAMMKQFGKDMDIVETCVSESVEQTWRGMNVCK